MLGPNLADRGLSTFFLLALLLAGATFSLDGCNESYWFGDGPGVKAKVKTPSGSQRGNITLVYTLTGEIPATDVTAKCSLDGLPFKPATAGKGGDGTRNLSVSPAGEEHTFVWDSAKDLGQLEESSAVLRIQPVDGTWGQSNPMKVKNDNIVLLVAVEKGAVGKAHLFSLGLKTKKTEHLTSVLTGGNDPFDVLRQADLFFIAHPGSNDVAAFRLNAEKKSVAAIEGSPFPTGGKSPKYLAFDGERVFVSHVDSGTIGVLDFDPQTGALSPNPHSGVPAPGCRSLAAPSERLYVASETRGEILVFDIGSDGKLTQADGSPLKASGLDSPWTLLATGGRLYASDKKEKSLWAFRITGNGAPAPLDGSPFKVSTGGIDAFGQSGDKVFAVSGTKLLSLTLGSSGQVAEDKGSPILLAGTATALQATGSIVVLATPAELRAWTLQDDGTLSHPTSSPVEVEVVRMAAAE